MNEDSKQPEVDINDIIIIGVDEGGYYTKEGYIDDEDARQLGFETPNKDFYDNWHIEYGVNV